MALYEGIAALQQYISAGMSDPVQDATAEHWRYADGF